jgi:histidine triad (HIT) family protein
MSSCVFCDIASGHGTEKIVRAWYGAVAIEPLNPVTPGHTLVIPRVHVVDASVEPHVTAMAVGYAAEYGASLFPTAYNLIVNCGSAASQTVTHLHWHVVPRREGDGLHLPWTGQVTT